MSGSHRHGAHLLFACERSDGHVVGFPGDSVGLTFAASGKAHSVVSRLICRTITTMCDHDLGAIVADEIR